MLQFLSLLIGLVTLAGCSRPAQPTSVYVDPALLRLVSPDAKILVGANLESLRKSPVYQEHFASDFAAQLDSFSRQTGLDPRKDIWEVLASSDGKSTMIMARGKFSVAELEPQIDKQGAQKTKYKGYTLYGDDRSAGVFMNSSTAIAGDAASVRAMLDRRDQAAAPPAALVKLAGDIPRGSQVWAVFQGNFIRLPFEEGSNLGNVNRILAGLDSGLVYSSMLNGIDFAATGNGIDSESTQSINDALRALLGLLRLNTRNDQKELLEIYDAIDIKQSGRTVKMTAHIKQDLVDQLLKSAIFNGFMGGRPAISSPGSRRPN